MKSIAATVAVTAALLVAAVTPLRAEPVGDWSVEGKGPDGTPYHGTATITATGDTFRVVWVIGRQKYVGTAVGNDEFFAVSYRSGDATGVAVYGRDGDGWTGIWTYAGATRVGAEKLTPR